MDEGNGDGTLAGRRPPPAQWTFGLWRAALISNALFAAGVAAVVLVLLGGTTWLSD
jgi:hypothetical protein